VEEVRRLIVVAALLVLSGVAVAQNSFDEHFALAKQGKLGLRETRFAKDCDVERASSTIKFARSLDERWTFKRVASVGNGRDDAEMDYLGNAEMWSVEGKPRLLNIWFLIMDTGNSTNEMYCLDQKGRVITQESFSLYEPVDGSSGGWRHLLIKSFTTDGKERTLTSAFVDGSGLQIAASNLDPGDLSAATTGSSPDLAKDVIAKISQRTK
jgi:hypothetical protein